MSRVQGGTAQQDTKVCYEVVTPNTTPLLIPAAPLYLSLLFSRHQFFPRFHFPGEFDYYLGSCGPPATQNKNPEGSTEFSTATEMPPAKHTISN
jgi:hypothetical protein